MPVPAWGCAVRVCLKRDELPHVRGGDAAAHGFGERGRGRRDVLLFHTKLRRARAVGAAHGSPAGGVKTKSRRCECVFGFLYHVGYARITNPLQLRLCVMSLSPRMVRVASWPRGHSGGSRPASGSAMGCGASSTANPPDVATQKPEPLPVSKVAELPAKAPPSPITSVAQPVPPAALSEAQEEPEAPPRISKFSSRVKLWWKCFLHKDPRRQILQYFQPGDARGPAGYLAAQGLRAEGPPSTYFCVWRPTSIKALRMMIEGTACGKGLNVKGKSAKDGELRGLRLCASARLH